MGFIFAALILIFDQISKLIISQKLQLNESIPVIKGVVYFTLAHNTGAAFSIFKNKVPFFIIAAIIAIILILIELLLSKQKHKFLYRFSLFLILSGAIGNLIDRILFGYVIDFIDLRFWPVFNVADSAITIGAILLGWSICFLKSAQ